MSKILTPRFAPVVPVQIAQRLKESDMLGNYHLLLAHDVVDKPDAYAEVYKDPDNFIIMDNSVIELGSAVTDSMLLEACDIVGANVLALPDVLLDGKATVESTLHALETWNLPDNLNLMMVPQGKSSGEWELCLYEVLRYAQERVGWIGIPKNYRELLLKPRHYAVQDIKGYDQLHGSNLQIHMLGFSNDWVDDLLTTEKDRWQIRGIDSASPIWMGLRGIHVLSDEATYAAHKREDFWEHPYAKGDNWEMVIENIKWVRRILGGDLHVS